MKGHKLQRNLDLSIQMLINWTESQTVAETGSVTCENPADGLQIEPWSFCCRSCSKTQCCGHLSQEPSCCTVAQTAPGPASKTRPPQPLEFTNTKKNERNLPKKCQNTFAAWLKLTWHVDSIWNASLLVFMRLPDVKQLDITVGQHGLQLRIGHHWRWSWMQNTWSYISPVFKTQEVMLRGICRDSASQCHCCCEDKQEVSIFTALNNHKTLALQSGSLRL